MSERIVSEARAWVTSREDMPEKVRGAFLALLDSGEAVVLAEWIAEQTGRSFRIDDSGGLLYWLARGMIWVMENEREQAAIGRQPLRGRLLCCSGHLRGLFLF